MRAQDTYNHCSLESLQIQNKYIDTNTNRLTYPNINIEQLITIKWTRRIEIFVVKMALRRQPIELTHDHLKKIFRRLPPAMKILNEEWI